MTYYLIYNTQTEELSKAQVKCLNAECINLEVSKDIYDNSDKYIYQNGEVVLNSNYEEEQKQKEQERIAQLTITKRVFAIALRDNFAIPYNQLKQVIAQSDDAQLEWDLCVELHRDNPLLDIMAGQMGITSQQLDYIFRKANGEDVILQVENEEKSNTNEIV